MSDGTRRVDQHHGSDRHGRRSHHAAGHLRVRKARARSGRQGRGPLRRHRCSSEVLRAARAPASSCRPTCSTARWRCGDDPAGSGRSGLLVATAAHRWHLHAASRGDRRRRAKRPSINACSEASGFARQEPDDAKTSCSRAYPPVRCLTSIVSPAGLERVELRDCGWSNPARASAVSACILISLVLGIAGACCRPGACRQCGRCRRLCSRALPAAGVLSRTSERGGSTSSKNIFQRRSTCSRAASAPATRSAPA